MQDGALRDQQVGCATIEPALDGARCAPDAGEDYAGTERRRVPRAPIAKPQWAVPRIDFLLPEQVPTRRAILAALDAPTLAACRAAVTGTAADRGAALACLTALVPAETGERSCDPPALIVAGDGANPEVHDHFFRVRRLGHGHPAGYLLSLLAAHRVLQRDLEDAQTSLEDADLSAIGQALLSAIAIGIGADRPPARADWTPAARPVASDQAVRRWIRGHQIFAALTQGLIFAFEAIEAASAGPDDAAMFEAADFAALVLRACAGALRFTGDFPPDVYEDLIRISMGAPFQPDGFSGLLSSDHRHLVRRMKLTRPSLERLNERGASRYEAIAAALAAVYDAHKCVCSQFVGTDRSSLMMVREVGRSAIDHLDRFKSARMRAIGVDEASPP